KIATPLLPRARARIAFLPHGPGGAEGRRSAAAAGRRAAAPRRARAGERHRGVVVRNPGVRHLARAEAHRLAADPRKRRAPARPLGAAPYRLVEVAPALPLADAPCHRADALLLPHPGGAPPRHQPDGEAPPPGWRFWSPQASYRLQSALRPRRGVARRRQQQPQTRRPPPRPRPCSERVPWAAYRSPSRMLRPRWSDPRS